MFRANTLRFSSWENNSAIAGKGDISGSFFEYSLTTKNTSFQYYKKTFLAGMDANVELFRINLDESASGHPSTVAGYIKQGNAGDEIALPQLISQMVEKLVL